MFGLSYRYLKKNGNKNKIHATSPGGIFETSVVDREFKDVKNCPKVTAIPSFI